MKSLHTPISQGLYAMLTICEVDDARHYPEAFYLEYRRGPRLSSVFRRSHCCPAIAVDAGVSPCWFPCRAQTPGRGSRRS